MDAHLDPIALAYHELRSPLGLVLMNARIAADEAHDTVVRARCEAIVRVAERLLRVAGQVLELERDAAATADERFSPVAIASALAADMQRFDVPVRLAASPAAAAAEVQAVPALFEALLQSLVNNALDHGEPGRCVNISLDAVDGALVMEVANRTGRGRRHSGLGAGIQLGARLADRLGGSLDTTRTGSRYVARFRLPFATPAAAGN